MSPGVFNALWAGNENRALLIEDFASIASIPIRARRPILVKLP
jgi:hypothetical protein